ncbi:MAG: hypothetical protein ACP5LG_06390, partial [Conexivisphaera sp.]
PGIGGPRAFLLRGPGVTDPEWIAEAFIHEFIEGAGGGGAPDAILRMDGTLERGVDSVRRVEQFVLTRSMLSPVKAVEVFSVGSMTADAQRLLASIIDGSRGRRVLWVLTSDNSDEIAEELLSAAAVLDLRPLSVEEIVSRLHWILAQRGIELPQRRIAEIAEEAGGSLHSAIINLQITVSGTLAPAKPPAAGSTGVAHPVKADAPRASPVELRASAPRTGFPLRTERTRRRPRRCEVEMPEDTVLVRLPRGMAVIVKVRRKREGVKQVALHVGGARFTLLTRSVVGRRIGADEIMEISSSRIGIRVADIRYSPEETVLGLADPGMKVVRRSHCLTAVLRSGEEIPLDLLGRDREGCSQPND